MRGIHHYGRSLGAVGDRPRVGATLHDLCPACERNLKRTEAETCQECWLKRRRLQETNHRAAARGYIRERASGVKLYVEAGEGQSNKDFAQAVREFFEWCKEQRIMLELGEDRFKLLQAIRRYWDRRGYSPTQRELAAACGFSRNKVWRLLQDLILFGYVCCQARSPRSIRLLPKGVG